MVSRCTVLTVGRTSATFCVLEPAGSTAHSEVSSGQAIIKLNAWNLSGDLSESQAFQIRLEQEQPLNSENPQQTSTRPSSQSSAIGVVAGVSIRVGSLFP